MAPDEWDLTLPGCKYRMRFKNLPSGSERPLDGSSCRIKVSKRRKITNETQNESATEKTLTIGEAETELERFFEKCLAKATVGSVMTVSSASSDDGGEDLVLEFLEMERGNPLYKMTDEEKLQEALRIKQKASALIQEYREEDAFHLLKRALRAASFCSDRDKSIDTRLAVIANMALCSLRRKDHERTIALCAKVIDARPDHVKCLLRRASAYDAIEEAKKARDDVERVLKIEPSNKAAQAMLKDIKNHIAKQKANYADLVKKMMKTDKN